MAKLTETEQKYLQNAMDTYIKQKERQAKGERDDEIRGILEKNLSDIRKLQLKIHGQKELL